MPPSYFTICLLGRRRASSSLYTTLALFRPPRDLRSLYFVIDLGFYFLSLVSLAFLLALLLISLILFSYDYYLASRTGLLVGVV